ncbi:MAG: hypothetical protein A2751_01990 [Candidatus Doudnabacteria bacterium RIFCSPHIGHO2_01_FULL_46_14]|uniref:Uncharacterized protein n=1 Tax=Candidatus Doudnabacteria bacterium RIFCSPHIGHO2_01_FULL_46_14 TaxID=1817824 RepID=A0A1F5NJS0_9BACT|nr:MAG: hypothetical protein A2751_01990 [Candidatus Doudnabacteria bacterium RIFCSPHIGHO2_01_FULL_46_14]
MKLCGTRAASNKNRTTAKTNGKFAVSFLCKRRKFQQIFSINKQKTKIKKFLPKSFFLEACFYCHRCWKWDTGSKRIPALHKRRKETTIQDRWRRPKRAVLNRKAEQESRQKKNIHEQNEKSQALE